MVLRMPPNAPEYLGKYPGQFIDLFPQLDTLILVKEAIA